MKETSMENLSTAASETDLLDVSGKPPPHYSVIAVSISTRFFLGQFLIHQLAILANVYIGGDLYSVLD